MSGREYVAGDIVQVSPEKGLYGGQLMIVARADATSVWGYVQRTGGHDFGRAVLERVSPTGGRVVWETTPGLIEGGFEIFPREDFE